MSWNWQTLRRFLMVVVVVGLAATALAWGRTQVGLPEKVEANSAAIVGLDSKLDRVICLLLLQPGETVLRCANGD